MNKILFLISITLGFSCGHSRSSLVDRQRTIKDSLEIFGKRIAIRSWNMKFRILDSFHENNLYNETMLAADTLIGVFDLRRIDSGGYYAAYNRLQKEYDSLEFELKK